MLTIIAILLLLILFCLCPELVLLLAGLGCLGAVCYVTLIILALAFG